MCNQCVRNKLKNKPEGAVYDKNFRTEFNDGGEVDPAPKTRNFSNNMGRVPPPLQSIQPFEMQNSSEWGDLFDFPVSTSPIVPNSIFSKDEEVNKTTYLDREFASHEIVSCDSAPIESDQTSDVGNVGSTDIMSFGSLMDLLKGSTPSSSSNKLTENEEGSTRNSSIPHLRNFRGGDSVTSAMQNMSLKSMMQATNENEAPMPPVLSYSSFLKTRHGHAPATQTQTSAGFVIPPVVESKEQKMARREGKKPLTRMHSDFLGEVDGIDSNASLVGIREDSIYVCWDNFEFNPFCCILIKQEYDTLKYIRNYVCDRLAKEVNGM